MRALFTKLRVGRSRGLRAPDKPLLVLLAIGRSIRGIPEISYPEVERELGNLLDEFGPPRKITGARGASFPFGHLRNDRIWNLRSTNANPIIDGPSGHVRISSLRDANAHGGFLPEIFQAFREDPKFAIEIAFSLVDEHFPETLRDDVLEATGIGARAREESGMASEYEYVRRRIRDSVFAREVLEAYNYRCVVCSFSGRIGGSPVALEAAHIKWHCEKGPDEIRNGLSLCVMHHRLFDRGAFTLSQEREQRIEVSPLANDRSFGDILHRFAKRPILRPASDMDLPDSRYVNWHRRAVFRPGRIASG